MRELADAPRVRDQLWSPFLLSADTLRLRAEERRGELRRLLGVVDPRVTQVASVAGLASAVGAAGTWGFEGQSGGGLRRVRWPVLSGVTAEGLLLVPARIRGAVVLLPDAAWTPEMLCGVSAGAEVSQGVVSRLAAVDLLVPWLRSELGDGVSGELPIGVGGVGEGGRIALAAAAVDERICSCWVAGYFQQREGLWQEPLDRNVWRMLTEFGDAEQAGMVAPRRLVLEACRVPEFGGVVEASPGRVSVAAPGRVEVCRLSSVRAETERARKFYRVHGAESGLQLVETGLAGAGLPGTSEAVQLFLGGLWPGAESGAGTESGAGVSEVAGAG
ncbi:MAG: hypothetical protein ACK5A1_07600, partial [Planctomyces sp.]